MPKLEQAPRAQEEAPTCPGPQLVDNFHMHSQVPYDKLCWAAVALSVDQLINPGSNWTQLCDVVGDTDPNPVGCCRHPSSADCNHEGILIKALEVHELHSPLGCEDGPYAGGHLNVVKEAHYWDVIKNDIDAGRVVCAGVYWGVKHYVAIYGYQECGGQQMVWIQDPLYDPSSYVPYSQFVTDYLGAGQWVEVDQIK